MQEQRQSVRLIKPLLVSYQKLTDYMRSPSRSKDISDTGICLLVFHSLEVGTTLKLSIDFKDNSTPTTAIGEVVWLKRRNNAEYPFEAGIKFVEINAANRRKISDYIKSLGDSPPIDWKG